MTKIIVFDLDGTLANIDHRLHFIHQEKKDWNAFNEACIFDEPIPEIVSICQAFYEVGFDDIYIITGREETVRDKTEAWLGAHGIFYDKLIMRPKKDYRKDSIVKEEQAKPFMKNIWMVFEDRKQVVDMWRSHGIKTLQVEEGDF
jgi:FMN phosphatase YigB (HAD superfamily)